MYSLFDGSVVINATAMHNNYITQLIVSRDSKTVISCSRDKKVKVWNWIKQTLTATLMFHDQSVESIALTSNEEVLFSASLDRKVGMWCMLTHSLLTTL